MNTAQGVHCSVCATYLGVAQQGKFAWMQTVNMMSGCTILVLEAAIAFVCLNPECYRKAEAKIMPNALTGITVPACAVCERKPSFNIPWAVCAKCKGPSYCTARCQTMDWTRHKEKCGKKATNKTV